MSRHENEEVDLDIQEQFEINKIYYLDDGTITNEVSEEDSGKIVAVKVSNKTLNQVRYLIKQAGGHLFNPLRKDVRYKKSNLWKLRSVRERTFKLYELFLSTKYHSYLVNAERNI